MKTDDTGCKKAMKRMVCLLLAVGLLCCFSAPCTGIAEEGDNAYLDYSDTDLLYSPETILAMDALSKFGILDQDGKPLQLRSGTALRGRGIPDTAGEEPDYTGMVGYAVIPNDPTFCDSPRFPSYLWMVPVYGDSENGISGQYGTISHKTPLVVVGQELKLAEDGLYKGYIRVIRLDRRELCWIDVHCFVTVPYWTMRLTEAPNYGYCLAVFREGSRDAPKTAEGKSLSFRDGTRVMIPYTGALDEQNPDPDRLPIEGVVYRKSEGKAIPVVVFFNAADLTLTY